MLLGKVLILCPSILKDLFSCSNRAGLSEIPLEFAPCAEVLSHPYHPGESGTIPGWERNMMKAEGLCL